MRVYCPICDRIHARHPIGEALRWHRIQCLRAPLATLAAWRSTMNRPTTPKETGQ